MPRGHAKGYNPAPTEAQVLAMCRAINALDDALGKFSDYEGDESGPTYYLWKKGVHTFNVKADEAIELHRRAIKEWQAARALNKRRALSGLL